MSASTTPPPRRPRGRNWPAALPALLLAVLPACETDDPFQVEFVESVDTTTIFSVDRPELGLPSAFDFSGRRTLRIQDPGATGQWDVALGTRDGRLVLLPPGALGIPSDAAVAPLGPREFLEVEEAPEDSAAYVFDEPVPITEGEVYAIQTREVRGRFGIPCLRYAKLGPIEVLPDQGILTFQFDVNPICDDRRVKGDPPDL